MALLDGQVALVTGGASGIGLAIARRFAAEGARVVIADIRPEEAEAAAQAAAADGLELHPQVVDVTDEASVQQAFDRCAERLGVPDAVVANAGILTLAPVTELDVERFRRVLDVNLTGVFLTAQAAVRALLAAGKPGSISVTSSIAGIRGLAGNAAYSAAKFGVTGLVQTLAIEVAAQGIRVNAVAPGQVDTTMARDVLVTRAAERGVSLEEAEQAMLAHIPAGRLAPPEEIADAFVYLASPLARYVTGHTLVADGGWLLG